MKKKLLFIIVLLLLLLTLYNYTANRNDNAVHTMSQDLQKCTVVIDAGHGGIDGGTVASDGTVEKGINLAIAKDLNSILNMNGIRTVMTRTSDDSIHSEDAATVRQKKISDIHNRLKIMTEAENAIFVSVHQNHFDSQKYHGTQVFYSRNNKDSRYLADCIQKSVVELLQPDNTRSIKQSGTEIYLLYHATKPAVMVECGFLSNPEETVLLKQPEYQRKVAISIYQGILHYYANVEEV